MGKIEDIIYENYKKALQEGNFDQAKRAAQFGQTLKSLVETEDFLDYSSLKTPTSMLLGQFFNPFPYKYNLEKAIIELEGTIIHLTPSENKLFYFLTTKETKGININIITKQDINDYMWGKTKVVPSTIRIAILRIRRKIEVDPKNPQVLISFYNNGYIFLGNKIS